MSADRLVFSSVEFMSVEDALSVVARYLVFVICSRALSASGLAGLKHVYVRPYNNCRAVSDPHCGCGNVGTCNIRKALMLHRLQYIHSFSGLLYDIETKEILHAEELCISVFRTTVLLLWYFCLST